MGYGLNGSLLVLLGSYGFLCVFLGHYWSWFLWVLVGSSGSLWIFMGP